MYSLGNVNSDYDAYYIEDSWTKYENYKRSWYFTVDWTKEDNKIT